MYECISRFNQIFKDDVHAPAHGYVPFHKDPFRKMTRT